LFFDDASIYENVDSTAYYKNLDDLPTQLVEIWKAFQIFPQVKINNGETIIFSGPQDFLDIVGIFSENIYLSHQLNVKTYSTEQLKYGFVPANSLVVLFAPNLNQSMNDTLAAFTDLKCQTILISRDEFKLVNQPSPVNFFRIPDNIRLDQNLFALSTVILFCVLEKTGFINDAYGLIENLQTQAQTLIEKLGKNITTSHNPAKRLAGQMVDRLTVFACAEKLSGVARNWRSNFRNLAKTCVFVEVLYPSDSSSWNFVIYPESVLSKTLFVFLKSTIVPGVSNQQVDLYHNHLLACGIGTDQVFAVGDNLLLHSWNLAIFGYFAAYYLAIANKVDPAENFFPQEN